jgi:hypothetical protein
VIEGDAAKVAGHVEPEFGAFVPEVVPRKVLATLLTEHLDGSPLQRCAVVVPGLSTPLRGQRVGYAVLCREPQRVT